jgi:hypothetical protein
MIGVLQHARQAGAATQGGFVRWPPFSDVLVLTLFSKIIILLLARVN